MINPTDIESQLELYAMSFALYQPHNTKSLSYHLFMKVDSIIQKQIFNLHDSADLAAVVRDTDKLIRELKAEYGLVSADLDEMKYPKFLTKLQALKVGELIVNYHNSIIHLLKLLLYIFSESENPTDISTELDSFLNQFSKSLLPKQNKCKKFKDIVNFEISDSHDLLDKIRQKQLDIIFDDEF